MSVSVSVSVSEDIVYIVMYYLQGWLLYPAYKYYYDGDRFRFITVGLDTLVDGTGLDMNTVYPFQGIFVLECFGES